jgi:hypothetical protein
MPSRSPDRLNPAATNVRAEATFAVSDRAMTSSTPG